MMSRVGSTCTKSFTIAEGIFNNLEGLWRFTREIRSKLPSSPSGTVTGGAQFRKTPEHHQYLYSEEGKFTLDNGGAPLHVSRHYFYEYDQAKDAIQVFFATDQSTKDRFFHTISLEGALKATGAFKGHGDHLCEADHYTAHYDFPCQGLKSFQIEFIVKGPQKDYVANTEFTKA